MKIGDVALVVDNEIMHHFPIGTLVVVESTCEGSVKRAYGLDKSGGEGTWYMVDSELLYIGRL